jgi:hypothetical protein
VKPVTEDILAKHMCKVSLNKGNCDKQVVAKVGSKEESADEMPPSGLPPKMEQKVVKSNPVKQMPSLPNRHGHHLEKRVGKKDSDGEKPFTGSSFMRELQNLEEAKGTKGNRNGSKDRQLLKGKTKTPVVMVSKMSGGLGSSKGEFKGGSG